MKRVYSWILAVCLLLSLTACLSQETPAPPAEGNEQVADLTQSDGLTVHFIDVGQADCALLQCDGEAMLIDGGNVDDGRLVVSYLQDFGVEELTYVVGTHAHEDHVGGLAAVLSVYPAEYVFSPVDDHDTTCFENFKEKADEQGLELISPEVGSVWPLGSAEITVLGPVTEYEDTNETSIVLCVDYGETSFLFTGDAGEESEHDMLDLWETLSATVLKVGHHGSNSSTGYRWLYEVAPTYGVISCGTDNDYGHPHEEPLSRLRDAGVQLYRTDLQGHIICRSDGRTVTFTTSREAPSTNPTAVDGQGQKGDGEGYIGNVKSKKFHVPSCSNLPGEQNRVLFETYKQATAAGYTPCGGCLG